jgi:hypothetical protein
LAIALTRHFNFACFIAADAEITGFVVSFLLDFKDATSGILR